MRKLNFFFALPLILFCSCKNAGKKQKDEFCYYTQGKSNRMAAEWEPASGVMITWPLSIPHKLAVELAKDVTVYTLVEMKKINRML